MNTHATAENAIQSVEPIDPENVVFIEGITLSSTGNQAVIHNDLAMLNECRSVYGISSDEYSKAKSQIIEQFSLPPNEFSSIFYEHFSTQIRLLLEKNCHVIIADYKPMGYSDEYGEDIAEIVREVMNNFTSAIDKSVFDTTVFDSSYTAWSKYKKLLEFQDNMWNSHRLREIAAVGTILDNAISLRDAYCSQRTSQNSLIKKPKAYVIYGTAHRDSLKQTFEKFAGVKTNVIELKTMSRDQYISPTAVDYVSYRKRRMAQKIYQNYHRFVTYQYGESFDVSEEEVVGMIEHVSEDFARSISLRCLHLIRLFDQVDDKDYSQALDKLLCDIDSESN